MQKFYKRFCLIAVCIFCFCFTFIRFVSAQQLLVDPSWNTVDIGNGINSSGNGLGFNGPVHSVVSGTEGTTFFGSFTRFSGAETGNCARFSGATLNSSFPKITFIGGEVSKAILTSGNDIIVIGNFTAIRVGNGIPQLHQAGIARISPAGVIDLAFRTAVGNPFGSSGKITDLQVVGTAIYIAGNFNSFVTTTGTIVPRPYFAKLDLVSGTYIPEAIPIPIIDPQLAGDSIFSIEVDPFQNFVLVGGKFDNLFNSGLKGIFKYNLLTSAVDVSFNISSFSGKVLDMQLISGGAELLIAGKFISGTVPNAYKHIAKISPVNAAIITSFEDLNPGLAASFVSQILELPGSKFVIGGSFNSLGATSINNLALINGNGDLQPSYTALAGTNGPVTNLCLSDEGYLIVAGNFTQFAGKPRKYVVLISPTGTPVNPPLIPTGGANGQALAQTTIGGKTYVAGSFNGYNDVVCNGLLRLLADGAIDQTLSTGTGFNGSVLVLMPSNGGILCAGNFSAFNGTPRNGVVRLLLNGSLDPTFNPGIGANDSVLCAAVQADGKILLGGSFTTFAGLPRNRLVRLNANGSIDATFSIGSGFNGTVRSIVQSGSLIYAGGDFSTFDGNNRSGIACLNANGSYSATANAGTGINPGGRICKIYQSPVNGQLFAGGRFSQYNGQNRSNLVKILFGGQPDPGYIPQLNPNGIVYDLLEAEAGRGLLVCGENLSQAKAGPSKGIIKLKPKGGSTFSIGTNGPVLSLKRDSSGNIIVTGDFTQLDTLGKNRVARITETALETTIWGGSDWDWDAPDCDFSALINGDYENQPGFTCKTLTILPAKKFFPDSTVWICRNAYNYGNQINGRVYLKDLNADTVHQVEGIFDDVTLDDDSGAVVTDPVTIRGTLKLKKGIFNTSNQLTLRSTAAKTGRIGKIESGANISGQVTMERFVPGGVNGWHFLGTPIKNQIQGNWADDFLILPNFIYHHDEGLLTDSGWVQTTDSLSIGRGFRVWLNQPFFNSQATFRNTGIPHTGNFNFNVSYSPGGYGGGGWNFLANPYPSEVDWHAFAKTNVGNEIHYWNGNIYGSYNSVTEIGVNGAGRYIPSSQAFFVKASASGPALSVTESAKPDSAPNPTFLRSAVNVTGQVARIRLKGSNLTDDETAIRWMDGVQNAFEDESDSRKLRNPGLNIYSLTSDGRRSSIQARMSGMADSVHFGLSVPVPGNYLLDIRLGEDLLTDKNWFIFDHTEKTYNRVSASTLLPFPVTQNETEVGKRFTLFTRQLEEEIPELIENRDFLVFPNPSRDEVRIFGMQKEESFLLEHSSGQAVLKGSTDGLIKVKGLSPGLYFLSFPEINSIRERLKVLIAQ
jgi:hypothetical protein